MENNPQSLAIYARKSTESEDRQILSIDSQVKELRDFAARQGLAIARVFTESMSAKSPGRPIFNDFMKQIRQGTYNAVLCWKLDRLARNPVDGGALIWAMEEKNLQFIHTPGRSFQNKGDDKFWMQLEFGMAKKYVDDLSDNVRRGNRARVALGWCPGIPPLGYLNDKETKTIVKDPERFPIMRKMWELMLSGNYSPQAILDIATERWCLRTRIFKRMGGNPIARSAIYDIFTNQYYCGLFEYGGQLYEGAHPPMVTKAEFDRVQELLGLSSRPRPNEYYFPYTGLIACGECGAAITAEHKQNRYGHHYVYYHCTKRKRGVRCSQRVIERKMLEAQMESFIESLAISSQFRDWAIDMIKRMHQEEIEKSKSTTGSLRRRRDACLKEQGELLNLKLRGLLNDEEYLGKKNDLLSESVKIRELLADSSDRPEEILSRCEEAFEFASSVKGKFKNGSPEVRHAIVGFTGSNLLLNDGVLRIEAKKPMSYIQKATHLAFGKNGRFEPRIFGQPKSQKQRSRAAFDQRWAAIDDVRTFYRENYDKLEFIGVPSILKSTTK